MRLKVNKDNIYVITAKTKYDLSKSIGNFMENDFSVFIRAKIEKSSLAVYKESFMFARNGLHAGISVFLGEQDQIWVRFSYWFNDILGPVIRKMDYQLERYLENSVNDYYIACNSENQTMSFYINNNKVDDIHYDGLKKASYNDAFIWIGCGGMIMSEDYRNIGNFEYDLLFALDKCLTIEEATEIANNYKTKYTVSNSEFGLPILNDTAPYRKNFKMFFDFEHKNRYKVWNMTAESNHLQLYIENNIYY